MNKLEQKLQLIKENYQINWRFIQKMVKEFPNDQKLGEAVRELYNK